MESTDAELPSLKVHHQDWEALQVATSHDVEHDLLCNQFFGETDGAGGVLDIKIAIKPVRERTGAEVEFIRNRPLFVLGKNKFLRSLALSFKYLLLADLLSYVRKMFTYRDGFIDSRFLGLKSCVS